MKQTQNPLHFLIADDHAIVRFGIGHLLEKTYTGSMVSGADDFDSAIRLLAKQRFNLIILDVNLPGGNSIQMVDAVRHKQPNICILVYTGYDEQSYASRFLKAGANGFLNKSAPPEEVKRAVDTLLNGGTYASESVKNDLLQNLSRQGRTRGTVEKLSDRELEVVQLLVQGKSATEIAEMLSLHNTTVSTYKKRIFEKLDVTTLIELAQKYRFLHP